MTYRNAKTNHLSALTSLGWAVKGALKVPHATSPDKSTRIYFKAQAVYAVDDAGPLNEARSLHCDMRTVATEKLVEYATDLANFLRDT